MTFTQTSVAARLLLAGGVLFGASAAHAAAGYNIAQGQEALIHPGMTMAQVQGALGSPERNVRYGNEPGPTWTYRVMNAPFPKTRFDVDFGPNGRVASVDQRVSEQGS